MKVCRNAEVFVQRILLYLLLCIDIANTNHPTTQIPYNDLENTASLARDAQRNDFYSIKSNSNGNRETSSGRRD